jgi:hypothetical protein
MKASRSSLPWAVPNPCQLLANRLEGRERGPVRDDRRLGPDASHVVCLLDRLAEPECLLVAKLVDALDDLRELMDVVGGVDATTLGVNRRRQWVERQAAETGVVDLEAFGRRVGVVRVVVLEVEYQRRQALCPEIADDGLGRLRLAGACFAGNGHVWVGQRVLAQGWVEPDLPRLAIGTRRGPEQRARPNHRGITTSGFSCARADSGRGAG